MYVSKGFERSRVGHLLASAAVIGTVGLLKSYGAFAFDLVFWGVIFLAISVAVT